MGQPIHANLSENKELFVKKPNFGEYALSLFLLLGVFLGFIMMIKGQDTAFRIHGLFTMVASGLGVGAVINYFYGRGAGSLAKAQGTLPFYNDSVVKVAVLLTVFWGLVGFSAGVLIASQMAFPVLNVEPYFNFGRLRPLHTSAVVFAFGGNALLASSFYVVQRTSKVRLFGGLLPWFVLLGYNFFIILAATGYLMGQTQGLEYAEPEWYIDLFLTLVWVCYGIVFVGTLMRRKEPHIYVANWFFLAFILTVAVLHIVNNLALPVDLLSSRSVPLYYGAQGAMVQWWYGHNAVGFFLTAAFLGMMYYFIPKRAERPVFSYRLSIFHFWTLLFIYVWAGPHHLHYTALPFWVQSLGTVFSIMLWMPSWGGMLNGILTLSGAWDKLRTDPVIRFMVLAVAFYGMSTFEGPLMALPWVNALSHNTDWTIGHVHSGALGWVGLITFGALYCMVPWLWKRDIYSKKLIEVHFALATIGILVYIVAMWISGVLFGLMERTVNPDTGLPLYQHIEIVRLQKAFLIARAAGGGFYLLGAILMAYNFYKTIRLSKKEKQVSSLSSASVSR